MSDQVEYASLSLRITFPKDHQPFTEDEHDKLYDELEDLTEKLAEATKNRLAEITWIPAGMKVIPLFP